MNQTTRLITRSLQWFNASKRTVPEVNAYLLALQNAGIGDEETGEIAVAFERAALDSGEPE